jgi:hypothetical protein
VTIRQLREPCWVLDPSPYEDDPAEAHYKTWHDADEALRELRDERGPDPADLAALEPVRPARGDGGCWVAECYGQCEELFGTDDTPVLHASTRADLLGAMSSYGWVTVTGELPGEELAYCDADLPAGLPLPPPTAAELEAAGQMRLPGVA